MKNQKYQYHRADCFAANAHAVLNNAANEGWELVSSHYIASENREAYIFKRPGNPMDPGDCDEDIPLL